MSGLIDKLFKRKSAEEMANPKNKRRDTEWQKRMAKRMQGEKEINAPKKDRK